MEEGKRYTKDEIVQFTINILEGIQGIPVILSQQIGVPIQKAAMNLHVLQRMMEQEKKAAEEGGKDDE